MEVNIIWQGSLDLHLGYRNMEAVSSLGQVMNKLKGTQPIAVGLAIGQKLGGVGDKDCEPSRKHEIFLVESLTILSLQPTFENLDKTTNQHGA